jgi:hypothetical protein
MVKMAENFENEVKKAVQLEPVLNVPTPRIKGPPVFIKVDRFKELLDDIQQLRSYSLGLRDALDAMSEIEKEFKTAMNLTNKVLDKVNMLLSSIDMKLMKKGGEAPAEALAIKPPPEIEAYVKGIYEQIDKLKTELQAIA